MFGFRNQRDNARTTEAIQSRLSALDGRLDYRATRNEAPAASGAQEEQSEFEPVLQQAG